MREPAVGRGVQLPEFADLRALPAAHWSQDALGRDGMSHPIFDGPAADLGAVEFEGVQAQGFRSSEAVRTGWRASQSFFEEVCDGLRPRAGVIAAGSARYPKMLLLFGPGEQVSGGQRVKAAAREIELLGRFGGRQRVPPKGFEHVTDQ